MVGNSGSEPDLLYGMKRIAQHLGLTNRQVEHMISRGSIPTFKIGKITCATRSDLQRHFTELASRNVAAR